MTAVGDTRVTARSNLGKALRAAADDPLGRCFDRPDGLPFMQSFHVKGLFVDAAATRGAIDKGLLTGSTGEVPTRSAWDCATNLTPLGQQVARMLAAGHAWVRLVDARTILEGVA